MCVEREKVAMLKLMKTIVTFLLVLCFATSGHAVLAKNIIKDGSFEKVKSKDKYGRVFSEWNGWIYKKTAFFKASQIATKGKYSCLMRADETGKIRITSPKLEMSPGRYKVTFDVRGLDIAPHRWKRPIDFSMGFDDKYFRLNKTGSFDWTQITYVFDIPANLKADPKFFLGLLGTGWLWVDNINLVKVSRSTPLTDEPQWAGKLPPIQSEKSIRNPVSCQHCGYHNEKGHTHCFACGESLPSHVRKEGSEQTKVFADFEISRKPFSKGNVSTTFASRGKQSLKIDKGWTVIDQQLDFSGYDELLIDLFNPNDEAVQLRLEIRDFKSRGYWDRVNIKTIAKPGKSTFVLPTNIYVGEKARPGRLLIKDRITMFSIGLDKPGPIYVDNFRLNRIDVGKVLFDELKAFDFGLMSSPLLSGYLPVSKGQKYAKERGFGFVNAKLWRSHNVLQPDPLVQDFVCPESGKFRVDLKNGKYRVLMKIDSPGGYWGEVPQYKRRRVTLNGKRVIDDRHTFESFTKNYFQDSDREDLPGFNPFKKYVESRIPWREFQVTVKNGRLEIGFSGNDWSISLSSLIIFPEEHLAKGKKFVDWINARREYFFNHTFQENKGRPRGLANPDKGFRLFTQVLGDLPGPHDGPSAENVLKPTGKISLIAAASEYGHLQLGVQSGSNSQKGEIEIKITDLKSQDGNVLYSSEFETGWFDYRIKREFMDGSVWSLQPRYFHRGKVQSRPGLTRTFLVGYRIPKGKSAGTYKGLINIYLPGGNKQSIPFEVKVLPFNLEPIEDVAVGPWGSGIRLPWFNEDKKTRVWRWQVFEKSLRAIKNSGATSFSGRPSLLVKAEKGFMDINTSVADEEMKLARSLGFHHMISSYGIKSGSLGYRLHGVGRGPHKKAYRYTGFPDFNTFINRLWGKLDRHAVKNNWLPVAWNLCDEPSEDRIDGAIKNAQFHRALSKGLKRNTFMGATSLYGNKVKDKRRDLAKALPVAVLNKHDADAIRSISASSNMFGFYNDASRWTMGRYMKMLVVKHKLGLRLVWHYNVAAGNPYYALDCREDDYCWYNSNVQGELVPSAEFLTEILPGLTDYRYLTTLQQKLAVSKKHPNWKKAEAIWKKMMDVEAGVDMNRGMERTKKHQQKLYEEERQQVISAIMMLEQ